MKRHPKPRVRSFKLSADGKRLVVLVGDRLYERTEGMELGQWGEIKLPAGAGLARKRRRPA